MGYKNKHKRAKYNARRQANSCSWPKDDLAFNEEYDTFIINFLRKFHNKYVLVDIEDYFGSQHFWQSKLGKCVYYLSFIVQIVFWCAMFISLSCAFRANDDLAFPITIPSENEQLLIILAISAICGLYGKRRYLRNKFISLDEKISAWFVSTLYHYFFLFVAFSYACLFVVLISDYAYRSDKECIKGNITDCSEHYGRGGHYYVVEYTIPLTPNVMSRRVGDDSPLLNRKECNVVCHKGLFGLYIIDELN